LDLVNAKLSVVSKFVVPDRQKILAVFSLPCVSRGMSRRTFMGIHTRLIFTPH